MQVRKRSGILEAVNLEKITNSIKKSCEDMEHMDIYKIAIKTISGIYDGIPTKELDLLSIKTAVEFIVEDPNYSKVASRILSNYIQKEVNSQEIYSFSQSIDIGYQNGLISEQTYNFVNENKRKLNSAIKNERNHLFEYYGLRVVYDRYLLKHPINRNVIENPQYFLMRVACGLSSNTKEVIDFYNMISSLDYMPSTPTLFNSGTQHSQMSSCFIAGTQIMTTNRGIQNIENVKIGDIVVTHRGRKKPVTQLHKNKLNDRKLYNVNCYGTPSFTVTNNHKFWSISNKNLKKENTVLSWNSIESLKEGDWIALPSRKGEAEYDVIDLSEYNTRVSNIINNLITYQVEDDKLKFDYSKIEYLQQKYNNDEVTKNNIVLNRFLKIDNNFAKFLGLWYSNGSVQNRRISENIETPSSIILPIDKNNRELIEFCKKTIKEYIGIEATIIQTEDNTIVTLSIDSIFMANVFVEFFGKNINDNKIYVNLPNWNRSLYINFLAGLLSGHNSTFDNGILKFHSDNYNFIKFVYMTGRNLGIPVIYSMEENSETNIVSIGVEPIDSISESVMKFSDKIKSIKDNNNYKSSTLLLDDTYLIKIENKKLEENVNPEYVYTLGVAEDHSYTVEGLLCENCYLLPPPIDDLKDIYKRYQDVAMLSKWAGGIGISMSGIRSSGQLIKGTNGKSNGIIPWIHTLDASVASVNQCLLSDQQIKTPYGYKEISNIKEGDLVYTTNSIDTVDKILSGEYSGNIMDIKTREGVLSLTPEHPVLVSNPTNKLDKFEWVKAGELDSSYLIVRIEKDVSHPPSKKNDLHDYDHRHSLSAYNEEYLYLNEKDLSFSEIVEISSREYTGTVYDLEMKETKNYQTNVAIVHNGGKRKGAAAVYLDTWHPDIMEFLELRDNTGDKEKRAHNLNLANWIPDIFMKRLKKSIDENIDVMWSLIDPSVAPELLEIFGDEFEKRYLELEEQKKYSKQILVKDLYYKMLKTLSETGNGWVCFKDTSNLRCNSAVDGNIVRLSNLCLAPDTSIRIKLNGEITDVSIELLTDLYKQDNNIQILSFNEITQTFEWDNIMNVGLTDYSAEVLTIEYDGNILECTEDHLILTNRGWIKAGNLLETDTIVQNDIGPVHKLEIIKLQEQIDNVKYSASSF